MPLIPLTQDRFAEVDEADYPGISRFRWRFGAGRYAVRWEGSGPDRTLVLMHRQLLGYAAGDVDHIDGDGLNNRRSNLRSCSRSENMRNARVWSRKDGSRTSRFKGVSWDRNCWRARIYVNGRAVPLGWFGCEEEAARAYDAAALEHFGRFARPNLPTAKVA